MYHFNTGFWRRDLTFKKFISIWNWYKKSSNTVTGFRAFNFNNKTKFLYVYFRVNTNRSEIRARASSLISRRRDDVITITLLQWRHRLRFRIKMIISQFQLFQSFVFLKLITFYHDLIILILFLYNHYVISVLRNGRISVQYEQRLDRDFSAIATRNRN